MVETYTCSKCGHEVSVGWLHFWPIERGSSTSFVCSSCGAAFQGTVDRLRLPLLGTIFTRTRLLMEAPDGMTSVIRGAREKAIRSADGLANG